MEHPRPKDFRITGPQSLRPLGFEPGSLEDHHFTTYDHRLKDVKAIAREFFLTANFERP